VAITVRFRFRLWLTIPDVTWTSYELYHTEKQATLRLSREIAFFYFFNALLMRTDVNLERNQKHVIRFKNSSLENCAETMSITGCFLRANKLKHATNPTLSSTAQVVYLIFQIMCSRTVTVFMFSVTASTRSDFHVWHWPEWSYLEYSKKRKAIRHLALRPPTRACLVERITRRVWWCKRSHSPSKHPSPVVIHLVQDLWKA